MGGISITVTVHYGHYGDDITVHYGQGNRFVITVTVTELNYRDSFLNS